jgi:hypothetical protein
MAEQIGEFLPIFRIVIALQVEIFEEQIVYVYPGRCHYGKEGGSRLLIARQSVSIGVKKQDTLGGRNGRAPRLCLGKNRNAELPD